MSSDRPVAVDKSAAKKNDSNPYDLASQLEGVPAEEKDNYFPELSLDHPLDHVLLEKLELRGWQFDWSATSSSQELGRALITGTKEGNYPKLHTSQTVIWKEDDNKLLQMTSMESIAHRPGRRTIASLRVGEGSGPKWKVEEQPASARVERGG